MAPLEKKPTQSLLARAHSPDTTAAIFADKIQHRPLLTRPSSPQPGDGRDARRGAREARRVESRRRRTALKPKPLSARRRRALGLYAVPRRGETGGRYATFVPLHKLWLGYVREILGEGELRTGGSGAAAKLASAEFHGAEVEVVRSRCVSRVGIRGIVVKDAKFVFEMVTPKNQVKMVPKEGTVFRIRIPLHDNPDEPNSATVTMEPHAAATTASEVMPARPMLVFDLHGNQCMHRPADRATKKIKERFYNDM